MKKEKYLSDRKALLDAAQALLDEGKLEDFQAKTKEIEALDAQFENEAKAQANLNALSNTNKIPEELRIPEATVPQNNAPDFFDSAEYKDAFMKNVLLGTAIPAKFQNVNANTTTGDVGSVIPTSTLQKIYEKMENLGMILPLVTQTGYKGGLSVPTSNVKPTATWVAEGAGSDRQKVSTGSVTFAYHKLRCAVSMSYETANMSYPMFEAMFVKNVSEAMVKAKEIAIIKGTGSGQPKGVLKETPTANIEIEEGSKITYAALCEAEGEEIDDSAVWCMTKKTYTGQILGMVDADGQPVARTNSGINGKPEYSILGRRVVLVNPDYMDTYAVSVEADSIIAFMYNFSDYIFNSGVSMTVKRYYDEDVDDEITKAIEVCDGKSVRNDSLVTVTVKAAV